MELLLRLVAGRSLTGFFLAGDPQQVINPSGFRWAEMRSRIRDRFLERGRPAPDLQVLTRNFRSVRGLVELANEVLAFKRDRTGRSEGDESEQSEVAGAAPILVVGDETALADAIRGFGPRCAVVAGSADIREQLQATLETTRVFTVPEAKGLEFDVAILWGVVAADPEPWRRLLDPDARAPRGSSGTPHAPSPLRGGDPGPPSPGRVRTSRRAPGLERRSLRGRGSIPSRPPRWRACSCVPPRPTSGRARPTTSRSGVGTARPPSASAAPAMRGARPRASPDMTRLPASMPSRPSAGARSGRQPRPRVASRRPNDGRRPRPTGCGSETRPARAAATPGWPRRSAGGETRRLSGKHSRRGRTPRAAGRTWASGIVRSAASPSLRARPADPRMRPAGGKRSRSGTMRSPRGRPPAGSANPAWHGPAATKPGADGMRRRPPGRGPAIRTAHCAATRRRQRPRDGGKRQPAPGSKWEIISRRYGRGSRPASARRASAAPCDATWPKAGLPVPPRRSRSRAISLERPMPGGARSRPASSRSRSSPCPCPRPPRRPGEKGASRLVWPAWQADAHGASGVIDPPRSPARGCAGSSAQRGPQRTAGASRRRRPRGRASAIPSRSCAVRSRTSTARATSRRPRGSWNPASDTRTPPLAGRGPGRTARPHAAWPLLDEKRGRLAEAALAWEKLGQPARAARCRAILCFRRGEYEEAARGYDTAGETQMAVTARVLAAKLRGNYEAADKAVKESGMEHMRDALLGDRQTWLAEARALAAGHAKARSRGAQGRETAARPARPASRRDPLWRAGAGGSSAGTTGARRRLRRHPRCRATFPGAHLRGHRPRPQGHHRSRQAFPGGPDAERSPAQGGPDARHALPSGMNARRSSPNKSLRPQSADGLCELRLCVSTRPVLQEMFAE